MFILLKKHLHNVYGLHKYVGFLITVEAISDLFYMN